MIASDLEKQIIKTLPYASPFHFVERIFKVDSESISGGYTFKKDDYFYKGHFKHIPVTPGVMLVETMGQIGMVSHLIYLLKLYEKDTSFYPLLTNMEVDFMQRVYPDELMIVNGQKVFYRNNTLRSEVEMLNQKGELCVRAKFLLQFIFE